MLDLDLLLSNRFYVVKKLQRDAVRQYGVSLKGKLLDLGCGRRPYKKYINFQSYTGMERNAQLGPDVVGSALCLPFNAQAFDSILCTEVLEHLPRPEQGIKEITRVLKPGGMALISAPMSWCLHYEPHDFYRFTKYGLEYLLHNQGLEILKISRIGGAFSLIGMRFLDVFYVLLNKATFFLLWGRLRKLVCMGITIPLSLTFMLLGKLLDGVDHRDAIDWIVLAKKREAGMG